MRRAQGTQLAFEAGDLRRLPLELTVKVRRLPKRQVQELPRFPQFLFDGRSGLRLVPACRFRLAARGFDLGVRFDGDGQVAVGRGSALALALDLRPERVDGRFGPVERRREARTLGALRLQLVAHSSHGGVRLVADAPDLLGRGVRQPPDHLPDFAIDLRRGVQRERGRLECVVRRPQLLRGCL